MRLVGELDGRIRALRNALNGRDVDAIRALARDLAEAAHEDAACTLMGLEEDGLVEEMEISLLLERAEDMISFCRLSMQDTIRDRAGLDGSTTLDMDGEDRA